MKIQLIIIGNELLNGKTQDKNAAWFSRFVQAQHDELTQIHIVPDDEKVLMETLKVASTHADLIVTSGGLGPTQDDITKKILANFFNKKIEFNARALEVTLAHYQRYQREYQQDKFDYQNLPQDFFPFLNPVGFAPGLGFQFAPNKFIACLPGVPSEFNAMMTQEIYPFIKKKMPNTHERKKHIIVKTWKIPESKIFNKLAPDLWQKLSSYGQVSSLPHLGGVDIGVEIKAQNENDLILKEKKIIDLIQETPIKDYIWHIGPESLEEVIIKKAQSKKLKIGFAESCTGGLCASRITDISGSSSVFWGSIVSYSNEVKMNCLQVQEQTLKEHGAVSLQTAKEMARGAVKSMNIDIAVTTTGIAGPGGGSKEKPVGTVGIGVATKEFATSEIFNFKGSREHLKYMFSQIALFKMLEAIDSF